MIHETGFDDTFYYLGNERQIRDWPIVREFLHMEYRVGLRPNRVTVVGDDSL